MADFGGRLNNLSNRLISLYYNNLSVAIVPESILSVEFDSLWVYKALIQHRILAGSSKPSAAQAP
jgi:hypothetical protein